jgi:hypothetical protein
MVLLATISKDTLILDASTIDAATARQVGEGCGRDGCRFYGHTGLGRGSGSGSRHPRLYVRGYGQRF